MISPPESDQTIRDRALVAATALARQAGAILRDRLDVPRDIAMKGVVDLVTDADKSSETLISAGLRETFPEFRLIGEEGSVGSGASMDEQPWGWVIDPLDGTTNYAHRYPHFAVSICLEHRGDPVVGVVYDPMRDELFAASLGEGATLNGKPIQVTTEPTLRNALLATGFSYWMEDRPLQYKMWSAINTTARGVRRDGAAALNLAWVAAGRLDGFWERPVQAWDMGAGVVLVREAGGIVTRLEDDGFDLYSPQALAANAVLHAEIQRELIAIIAQHDAAAD